jgi:hypothetical protein
VGSAYALLLQLRFTNLEHLNLVYSANFHCRDDSSSRYYAKGRLRADNTGSETYRDPDNVHNKRKRLALFQEDSVHKWM